MTDQDLIDFMKLPSPQLASSLTKRELFAAMAMHGILANSEALRSATELQETHESYVEATTRSAVVYSDALINELNKEQK